MRIFSKVIFFCDSKKIISSYLSKRDQRESMNSYSFLVFSLILLVVIHPVFALDSPRQQLKNGVPSDKIICNDGLVLVMRPHGIPACVKPSTAERFEERGWKTIAVTFESAKPKVEEILTKPVQIKEVPVSQGEIETVPASQGSVVNFYVTDDDLNTSHSGVDIINTAGLLEFTINSEPIQGPETMIETGLDTGRFYVRLDLPDTINGRPLNQDDVIMIRYLDQSDAAGEQRILVESVTLQNTYANFQGSGGSRIGHEFTLRIYEPDANLDSRDEDRIPLSSFEYRGEGGIRTTLANPKFDANRSYLVETGENTGTFEVVIKIPRELDGKVVHIGDWYEIRYIDRTTPSGTSEKVILKGRIG